MVSSRTDRRLRIAYFGTPEFAVPTLRRLLDLHAAPGGHEVVALVSQPDRPKGRGHRLAPTPTKELAVASGIPVLQPERLKDEAFLSQISALSPDLGVVAAYGRLLPDELLSIPPLGMINVHASLLPRWRGAAPVHRAVIAGDHETGITIMRVVKELDAGASFKTVRRPIDPDETSVEVERDLAEMGADLLLEVLQEIAGGRSTETPQDPSLVTYATKITKAEGAVEWSLPAERRSQPGARPSAVAARLRTHRWCSGPHPSHRTDVSREPRRARHHRPCRTGTIRSRRGRRPRAARAHPAAGRPPRHVRA